MFDYQAGLEKGKKSKLVSSPPVAFVVVLSAGAAAAGGDGERIEAPLWRSSPEDLNGPPERPGLLDLPLIAMGSRDPV